ncbi:MAG: bifunctional UDP-N-acetylglucosamine diphosphorylase/glucosamine-1-phosphate N-acetyltransferase GlmU [Fusobacteriaceae bacterium]|jgi:bifunctional UDP-N-acetylglucosamine pyrophosphorylase/glucosamine-1-phosphate N-acetyltransferase|nr:bifunctional UDP-N-acetylglucosamine diphosphorylase/glucosamine-1-phosphate N-acetyltransferase GlmU [Fusobacteriaceae bacterium]
MSIQAIVLAAGKGTRMKSDLPKVIHKVNGVPMIVKIIRELRKIPCEKIVLVSGHRRELVEKTVGSGENVVFAEQKEQLGTGHAAMQAKDSFGGYGGDILVLCGDTPLLRGETLRDFCDFHRKSGAAATVMTAVVEDPSGYGRIIVEAGRILRITEEKDATEEEKAIREINAGVYCFQAGSFWEALSKVGNHNEKGEYYLTDVIGILSSAGTSAGRYILGDFREVLGVNSKRELAEASKILRLRKNNALMDEGVIILDPEHTYVEEEAEIGRDTVLYPTVLIQGKTRIGENCEILGNTRIADSVVDNRVRIESSVIEESIVENDVTIGPFAHLRPKSHLKEKVHIGNFVETKKSVLERGVKSGHLTYLGDAHVGENTNIGAGTITCNYDGKNKFPTTIGSNAFIGSDSILVAPVEIGDHSFIGAGSVITKNVPENSLSVERNKQLIKTNWRKK